MAAEMLELALSHFRAKRTVEAADAFSDALQAFSEHGGLDSAQQEMAHSMRGDCHAILGQFQRAEEDFSCSIEVAPDVAIYYYKRGSARRKLGQCAGAIVDLRRSVEMGCGLGRRELKQLSEAPSAGAARPAASSEDRSEGRSSRTNRARSHRDQEPTPTFLDQHETAEAEAVRAQLEVVQREQERLAKLTARVVDVALTDGKRERSARCVAEQAVNAERRRVEHAVATARRERDRAKAERRAARKANVLAQASLEQAAEARADAAEQRDRVAQYLLCAQAEIQATEREARQHALAMAKQSETRDAARQEQAARQQAAATAVLRKERAARAAAAEAQARAETRLEQAEADLAAAQREAAATAAAATFAAVSTDAAKASGVAHRGNGGGNDGLGGGECVICLDSAKEIMLEPCRHFCLCVGCAPRVSDCPVCRARVTKRVRLYM